MGGAVQLHGIIRLLIDPENMIAVLTVSFTSLVNNPLTEPFYCYVCHRLL